MTAIQIGDRVITPHGYMALVVDLFLESGEVEVAWRENAIGRRATWEQRFNTKRLVLVTGH